MLLKSASTLSKSEQVKPHKMTAQEKEFLEFEKNHGNTPSFGGEYAINKYLKNCYLKDPDSLVIMALSEPKWGNKLGWEVACRYRAKNSFGGYVVEQKIFYIHQGNVVLVE